MENISIITENLWVGGDPIYSEDLDADVIGVMAEVSLVVDCRSEEERYGGWDELVGEYVPVIHTPLFDDLENENAPQDFANAVEAIVQELEGDISKTVFIHCHMGVNRSPSLAMLWLILHEGYDARRAFTKMRRQRPVAGIAYAEEAAQAALDILSDERLESFDLDKFVPWHRKYWIPETKRQINDAIRERRQVAAMRGYASQAVHVDAEGMIHVVRA